MEQASSRHQRPLAPNDLVARPECPVCVSRERTHFRDLIYAKTTVLPYFRCEACGLIYLDPVPTQQWYNHLYGEEFWEAKSGVDTPSGDMWTNERQWRKGLTRAEKYIDILRQAAPRATINSVLEIGASFGLIGTTIADAFGAKAFGVEPNHGAREFAGRASGMTMVGETTADLGRWQDRPDVDLAIFSHVLENIIDPAASLAAVHGTLKTGGLLLVEMSNSDMRPSTSIYHPCCFSAASLRLLLEKCGFRVIQQLETGRPTSSVLPIYLTTVAEAVSAPAELPVSAGHGVTMVKSRHLLYRVFYKSPLGKLDLRWTWKRYSATAFVERGIGKLRASLNRLRSVESGG